MFKSRFYLYRNISFVYTVTFLLNYQVKNEQDTCLNHAAFINRLYS